MPEHKFRIGQILEFTPHRRGDYARSGKCKVVRLLPAGGGDSPQYRIKCVNENFERIVWENQLQ